MVGNNFRFQIFKVHLSITEEIANRTLSNYSSGSQIVDVSYFTEIIFVKCRKKLLICVSDIWKELIQRHHDNFWKGKVTCLRNIGELVRPLAAENCWDSKDHSGRLTSINVLTVQ